MRISPLRSPALRLGSRLRSAVGRRLSRWGAWRRWAWRRNANESPFVHSYLESLKGIEIGASAHNDFGVDAINVDRYASMDTVYKQEEIAVCGRRRHVDVVADGDELPFRDNAVDFVLASHVIEHFPDPIRALREWLRVARRYVVVVVPHRDRTFDHHRELTSLEELQHRHKVGFRSADDRHWSVWTCQSFLEMCRHLGLPVIAHQDPDDKVGNGFTVVLAADDGAASDPRDRQYPSAR